MEIDGVKLILIANRTGISYYMHSFDKNLKHLNEDMLTGLINALIIFSQETIQEDIQSAKFKNISIKFQLFENLMIVLIVDNSIRDDIVPDIMQKIKHRFFQKFSPDLKKKPIDFSVFKGFKKDVLEILKLDRYILEKFRDKKLYKSEIDFIITMEKLSTKQLRFIEEINLEKNGILIKDHRIVGLNLFKRNLTIIPQTLESLDKLEILYGNRNKIKYFNESFGKLKNLKFLNLENNQIQNIPDDFNNLLKLEEINFSWNKIEKLTLIFDTFPSLKKMNLSWNRITKIPPLKNPFLNLYYLNLAYNKITHLPYLFDLMPALQVLDMEGNKISTFNNIKNAEFEEGWEKNTFEITILNLKGNRLFSIPNYIGKFNKLTHLNLENNRIKDLPLEIMNLKNLEFINLRGNPLSLVSDKILVWLNKMSYDGCKVLK